MRRFEKLKTKLPAELTEENYTSNVFLLFGILQGVMMDARKQVVSLTTRDGSAKPASVSLPEATWHELNDISEAMWALYAKSKEQGIGG